VDGRSRIEALRRRVQQDPASIAFAQLAASTLGDWDLHDVSTPVDPQTARDAVALAELERWLTAVVDERPRRGPGQGDKEAESGR
jgi:hypothetical protein